MSHLRLLVVLCFVYSAAFNMQSPVAVAQVRHAAAGNGASGPGGDANDANAEEAERAAAIAAYGRVAQVFGVAQVAGAMMAGPLADAVGGRLLLVASFLASALSYGLSAAARSLVWLYAAKAVTLLQHAMLAARTLVARSHGGDDAQRAAALGLLGAAYGLGFATGPAVGGLLARQSVATPAWAAAGVSLVAAGVAAAALPPDGAGSALQKKSVAASAAASAPAAPAAPAAAASAPVAPPAAAARPRRSALLAAARSPGVPPLLASQAGAAASAALVHCAVPMTLALSGVPSDVQGLLLSGVGACVILSQVLVLPRLVRNFGQRGAARAGVAGLAAAQAMLALVGSGGAASVGLLFAALAPLAVAGTVVATTNLARLTRQVPAAHAGAGVALDMALGSAARALAPLPATLLLQRGGMAAVCGAAVALLGAGAAASSWLGAAEGERARGRGGDGGEKRHEE